jgi:hypothetical protein
LGRRRDWLVLAASLAVHVALLAAWLSKRPEFHFVEPPPMTVELVRLRPPPRPEAPPVRPSQNRSQARSDETKPETPPPPNTSPPPPPVTPRQLTDEELLDSRVRLTPRQIREAPVYDHTRWDRAPRPPRPKCKPAEGYPGPPLPCPGDLGKDPNRPFDVDRDAPDSELAREGRYKRAMKAYHEAPGGAGYPGIACAIFHRC